MTVAPDQSEFTLKIVADAKAAAATAKAEVALVFQVDKKDYPVPATPLGVKVTAGEVKLIRPLARSPRLSELDSRCPDSA